MFYFTNSLGTAHEVFLIRIGKGNQQALVVFEWFIHLIPFDEILLVEDRQTDFHFLFLVMDWDFLEFRMINLRLSFFIFGFWINGTHQTTLDYLKYNKSQYQQSYLSKINQLTLFKIIQSKDLFCSYLYYSFKDISYAILFKMLDQINSIDKTVSKWIH